MKAKFKTGELAITYIQGGFKLVEINIIVRHAKFRDLKHNTLFSSCIGTNKVSYMYGVDSGTMRNNEYIEEYNLFPIINKELFRREKKASKYRMVDNDKEE